jgi:hypothetical protein
MTIFMGSIVEVWGWIRDHAWIIAIVGVGILLFILSRGKFDFRKFYDKEKEVIDAKTAARTATIELGAVRAVEQIREQHEDKIKQLDKDQSKRVKELEHDPEKLVEAILRTTMVLLLFFFPLLAASSASGADDLVSVKLPDGTIKKCQAADAAKCAAWVDLGKAAPFAGVLQTPKQAAELAAKAEYTDARIQAAVDFQIKLAAIEVDKQKAIFDVKLQAEVDKRIAAEKALDAGSSWYVHPAFVVPVTILATCAAILAGAGISKKARQ